MRLHRLVGSGGSYGFPAISAVARETEQWLRTDPPAAEAARLDALPAARLASGPGLVAAAFGIDRTMTGLDLLDPSSPLRIEAAPPDEPRPAIETTPRIGIAFAGAPWTDVPWRFVIAGHPSVSGPGSRRTGRAG